MTRKASWRQNGRLVTTGNANLDAVRKIEAEISEVSEHLEQD
jgi:hypothetical protein